MNKSIAISIIIVIAFIAAVFLIVKNTKPADNLAVVPPAEKIDTSAEDYTSPLKDADDFLMTVVKQGTGDRVSKQGDTVAVRYVGSFPDGTIFDSNTDAAEDFSVTLGEGKVIQGWEIGLQGMKVGEVRKLTVPPEYGYGPEAYGPIPGNSTLIFQVELKSIK